MTPHSFPGWEPVRRRHEGPCPECTGTRVILHGGRVLECLGCGWEWSYANRTFDAVQVEIERMSWVTPPTGKRGPDYPVRETSADGVPKPEVSIERTCPPDEWPEWLTPENTAIHTAIENEMKRALAHCYSSADASGLDWTWEGWISVSAGNIMGMLRRAGSPPPNIGDVERLPMPESEALDDDADWPL